MFGRLKRDIEAAIAKIQWFASLLSERMRIEFMVFKLLYKSEELKKQRQELFMSIGEAVYEMRGKDRNIYADTDIAEAIKSLEKLEPEIKETIDRAEEISKVTA